MKRKITFIILSSILTSYLLVIAFSAINIKNVGAKGAEEKAQIVAELVKDGLTAHMVSGTMDHREFFINKIENSPNIKSLWIARSESVIEQYGEGFNNEIPRDAIDKEVIKTGKSIKKFYEDANNAQLRVTIPYIANKHENPDCTSCHTAKVGEVLGTISMVLDVKDVRQNGYISSFIIFAFSIFMMIIVFLIIHKSLNPVMALFESITYVMSKAQAGDYSKRVQEIGKDKDYKNVTFWINSLLDKLKETLDEIEHTVGEFITQRKNRDKDILIELKYLVHEMSQIHKFKKTIEFDEDKLSIYKRIGTILINDFQITDFSLIESYQKDSKVVFSTYDAAQITDPRCRALRTKQIVNSNQFFHICEDCSNKYKYYFCIPYTISNDLELMLHVGTNDKENIEKIKENIARFNDYINEARPEIISKNLTEILKISSNTDTLTGLNNRKYLDEYIEKAVAQAKRSQIHYGVMMIDIDFFKMVNDTYGHDVGDKVIKQLAKVLKESIRESDIAFRFGGEEFLVLLYNCNNQKIEEIAQKIRTTFEKQSFESNNAQVFNKTLSIGICMYPTDTDSMWKAIKYADISLYKAKESGRNKVVKFQHDFLDKSGISTDF
jgi:diguanylate cyclase (GGDEF)-like protein